MGKLRQRQKQEFYEFLIQKYNLPECLAAIMADDSDVPVKTVRDHWDIIDVFYRFTSWSDSSLGLYFWIDMKNSIVCDLELQKYTIT